MQKFDNWKDFRKYLVESPDKMNYFFLKRVFDDIPYANVKQMDDYSACYRIIEKMRKNVCVRDTIEYLQTLNLDAKLVISIYEECITDAGSDLGGHEEYSLDIVDLETRVVFQKAD